MFACKKNKALRPACTSSAITLGPWRQKGGLKGERAANLTTALGGQRSCYAIGFSNPVFYFFGQNRNLLRCNSDWHVLSAFRQLNYAQFGSHLCLCLCHFYHLYYLFLSLLLFLYRRWQTTRLELDSGGKMLQPTPMSFRIALQNIIIIIIIATTMFMVLSS